MYKPGTILELKERKGTEEKPFAYDEVEVIGQSPIQHGEDRTGGAHWVGSLANGVIIRPHGETFGATLDEPYGKLQRLYKVKALPTEPEPQTAKITTFDEANAHQAGAPSPEEVFGQAEAAEGLEPSDGRGRTAFNDSPLDDLPGAEEPPASPLDG